MFVQTGHYMEVKGKSTSQSLTFYGQEKTTATIRLARMNLAVHGLEGKIAEANTFYQDEYKLLKKADFVMANPPFNVDGVDSGKVKADPRLPFGLPGINKKKQVSNANYLWISYFYSYLNEKGRAGFVMSSQASSAGGGEKEVRRKLIETGSVDVMISIRSNFFYTLSVPCELWFLNNNKPEHLKEKVLMIDARHIYRMVTHRVYDFSQEQLKNITSIVWLYWGETDKYIGLVESYFTEMLRYAESIDRKISGYISAINGSDGVLIGTEQT
jgi:type I restriction enzyme M protein